MIEAFKKQKGNDKDVLSEGYRNNAQRGVTKAPAGKTEIHS